MVIPVLASSCTICRYHSHQFVNSPEVVPPQHQYNQVVGCCAELPFFISPSPVIETIPVGAEFTAVFGTKNTYLISFKFTRNRDPAHTSPFSYDSALLFCSGLLGNILSPLVFERVLSFVCSTGKDEARRR